MQSTFDEQLIYFRAHPLFLSLGKNEIQWVDLGISQRAGLWLSVLYLTPITSTSMAIHLHIILIIQF